MIERVLEFLFSLQRVSITQHTRLEFGVDWRGWIFLAALALALIGWWSYRRQSASPRKRLALGIVRAALLVVVFLLFCRPQLVVDREERQPSVVGVWVDNSASMALEDPYKDAGMREFAKTATGPTTLPSGQTRLNRYQLAVDALARAEWLKELAKTQHVAIFTGSGHAQLLGTVEKPQDVGGLIEQLSKGSPTGETTDVPMVLQEILTGVQDTRISAVVLLTDGQTTEHGASGVRSDEALAAVTRSGAKVIGLPLGEAQEPLDLKLTNMQLPENTFVRDPVAVRARLSGAGIDKPLPVKVTVYRKQGDQLTELVNKQFTLDPQKKEMDVELIFKPVKTKGNTDKAEKFDLVAKVEPETPGLEELTTKNNVTSGTTSVLDAQVNVLYVEGYPRWEYRYLKNELVREKTVNVATLLVAADDDFAQEGDPRIVDKEGREIFPGPIVRFPESPEELNKFDVLLIGDVDPTYFSPTQQKLIVDFVGKGGGIGWIAGMGWNPEGYKGTPLDVLLPIIPDELDPRARVMAPADNAPINLVLTAAGRESNLFKFFDDADMNAKQLTELPEMYWYKPVMGLAPAAEVLAVHPTRLQGGNPVPLIITGHYKRGRTLFSAIADTWRWRRYTGEPLFQSYWLQVCRLLYRNKALGQSHRLELTAESNRVEVGRPIRVTMEVRDPTLLGQLPPQVPVTVSDKTGRAIETVMLSRAPGSTGGERLEGVTTATEVGDVTLAIQPGLLPVDIDPFEMTIEPPQREFEKITADVEALTLLASKTDGAVVPLNKQEDLAKLIPDRSLSVLQRQAEELWNKPFALVLVIGLATAEWLLRKSAGLV